MNDTDDNEVLIANQRNEIAELQKKINELSAQVQKLKVENKGYQSEIQDLTEQNESLVTKVNDALN